MDKYNAQEPRTVNTINNGNITLLYVYYRVSQKKVMPFVIQICRELLVVEI